MKVLVRRMSNEKMYTWEDAKFDNGMIKVGDLCLYETDIVSIIDDDRNAYVKCSSCGAIIKNTPEEIEKHRKRYLDPSICFTCDNMRATNIRNKTQKYTLVSGHTYTSTSTVDVDIMCTHRSWYSGPFIDTEEVRNGCKYKRCESASMDGINDIFTRHPGVFDNIITVDKVLEVGYKTREEWGRGFTAYQLAGRNRIYALVNDVGIVDRFTVYYGRDYWDVCYSKLTDKLYDMRGISYFKWCPTDISENTIRYIKNKISALYE